MSLAGGTSNNSIVASLWGLAALQRLVDLDEAPLDSLEYGEAVAFFRGQGAWLRVREHVAAQLRVTAEYLEAVGNDHILARQRRGFAGRSRRGWLWF